LGNFLPIGLLLEAHHEFFCEDEATQNNGNILGYFFVEANLLYFEVVLSRYFEGSN
jgi:hypothetical protein